MVLTAAHCIHKDTQIMAARAGKLNLKKSDQYLVDGPYQDRKVEKVIVHEKFIAGNLFNDIALVFLKDDFLVDSENKNVGWICVPKQNQKFSRQICTVSGFGTVISLNLVDFYSLRFKCYRKNRTHGKLAD